MEKFGIHPFQFLGQGDPDLESVQKEIGSPKPFRGTFRVHDPFSGGHPIDRPGLDLDFIAQGIAVHDAALEKKGQGRKADVRMGHDVKILPFAELYRAHMVDEDKGANHSFLTEWQEPAHQKMTQIGSAFLNDQIDIGHNVLF